jgi:hypothetical protein
MWAPDLRQRVTKAVELITPHMLINTWQEIEYRLDICRTAAIQERVTAILWSIPNEAFADSFQKLYERCQPCVVKDDDYFEGQ